MNKGVSSDHNNKQHDDVSRTPLFVLISLHQNIASITSGTVPNGFRPSAATSTKTTTSRLVSPDFRGQPPRRVASRARRTTRGLPDYSRSSGVETVSSDYVVKRIIVLVPPINPPRKA